MSLDDCQTRDPTAVIYFNYYRWSYLLQGVLPVLTMLQITHNMLTTANDIAQLVECKKLTVIDLSHNRLNDPSIVQVSIKYM